MGEHLDIPLLGVSYIVWNGYLYIILKTSYKTSVQRVERTDHQHQ